SSGVGSTAGTDLSLPTGGNTPGSASINMSAATSATLKSALGVPATAFPPPFRAGSVWVFDPEDIVIFDGAGVRAGTEIAPNNTARSERRQAELIPISLNTSGAAPAEEKMAMSGPAPLL